MLLGLGSAGAKVTSDFAKFDKGQMSFEQVMKDVKTATHGNASEIMTLFGGIRGGIGALALLDSHWKDYLRTSKEVHGANDLLNTQWHRMTQSTGFLAESLKNKVELALMGMASTILPEVNGALLGLNHAMGWVISKAPQIRSFFDQIGAGLKALAPEMNNVGSAVKNLGDAFAPIAAQLAKLKPYIGPALWAAFAGAIMVVAAALNALAMYLNASATEIRAAVVAFNALKAAAEATGEAIGHFFAGLGAAVHNALLGTLKTASSALTAMSKIPLFGGASGVGNAVGPINNLIKTLEKAPPVMTSVSTHAHNMATQVPADMHTMATKSTQAAQQLQTGVDQHMTATKNQAVTAAQQLSNGVSLHMQTARTKVVTAAQQLQTGVEMHATNAKTNVVNAAQQMADGVDTQTTTMKTKAVANTQQLGDGIVQHIQTAKAQATSAMQSMSSSVSAAVRG